jgi:hypothetical protein
VRVIAERVNESETAGQRILCSVRRYLREDEPLRSKRGQVGEARWATRGARALLDGPAAGNAVVVRRLLAEQEVEVPLRTLQRVLAPHR